MRLIIIILAFTAVLIASHGLQEEIENIVNLQENIYQTIGDQ